MGRRRSFPHMTASASALNTFEESLDFLSGRERDDRLLPLRALTRHPGAAARALASLAAHADGVDAHHRDLLLREGLLHSAPDLHLVGAGGAAERVLARAHRGVGLLAHHRPED